MPTPTFQRVSTEQFEVLLQKFDFKRKTDAVHMHHTWRPRRADFRGHETIVSMWRFHTHENGWSDIAQHITIDPEGMIWLGRNWNLPPASAAGHNGNKTSGPFMFEMIGDFDRNQDPFDGPQKETVLKVIALVQQRFGLDPASLRFHNSMSPKSCPGTSIDRGQLLKEIAVVRGELGSRDKSAERGPAKAKPFPDEDDLFIRSAIRSLGRVTDNAEEGGNAEQKHEGHDHSVQRDEPAAPAVQSSRGAGIDANTLAAMRPHLVNLRAGRFSTEGEAGSTREDVDRILEEHLPGALTQSVDGKLRVLLYAHGGLVSESSGLQIAHKHIDWWKRNGVYPIYFVWETGLFETIGDLLNRARQGTRAVARDLADFTTDPIIEVAARALRGPRIWGGMKWSAERAVDPPSAADGLGGGAHYFAAKLKAFCDAHKDSVELHAVGHSAGSIFHSHFIPLAHSMGAPAFTSAHFMAPAVRVDTFKEKLLESIEKNGSVEHLTVYSMLRDYERHDDCAKIYRKSLLYLIYYALEDERKTPILGLEESMRGDGQLKSFFGLGGAPSKWGEVVWSVTASDSGNSASQSTTHGGFDDDPATMNSIAHRVLGKPDAAEIDPYPRERAVSRPWMDEVDWPLELVSSSGASMGSGVVAASVIPPAPAPSSPKPAGSMPASGVAQGRRIALCVGIDGYPAVEHKLSGCVNDARRWAQTLAGLGFETRLLVDATATRASLERELDRLVGESRSGDVIVFQYAGHGTQVPDLNSDEEDGIDEALCPVDFATGALYIDDDIAELFARIPDGVNMTCFMDCCHSGTNSRFAVGLSAREMNRPSGTKARFVLATPAIKEAHRQFRAQTRSPAVPATGSGGRQRMRDVKFSACLDHQVALESAGSGDFTLRATKVLARGIDAMSHEQFLGGVLAEFGSGARQAPMLDCTDEARSRPLLQPLDNSNRAVYRDPAMASDAAVLEAVNVLAQAVQALSAR
jgi:hypothetical protein